jgi:predicted Fe-Mo cluster-binding NifX family protein
LRPIAPAILIGAISACRDSMAGENAAGGAVAGVETTRAFPVNNFDTVGDKEMKIAIASQEPELSGAVDPRFGRARYFIIYDTGDDSWEIIDNTENSDVAHGAGIQTAQRVVDAGAEMIISGNFGPKAADVLKAAGVSTTIWAEGTVTEAIEIAKNNPLPSQA